LAEGTSLTLPGLVTLTSTATVTLWCSNRAVADRYLGTYGADLRITKVDGTC
jgi:hypothetical protein